MSLLSLFLLSGNVLAEDSVYGRCGISTGGTYRSAPTKYLCDSGEASGVVGIGNEWKWRCGDQYPMDCYAKKWKMSKEDYTEILQEALEGKEMSKMDRGQLVAMIRKIIGIMNDYDGRGWGNYTNFGYSVDYPKNSGLLEREYLVYNCDDANPDVIAHLNSCKLMRRGFGFRIEDNSCHADFEVRAYSIGYDRILDGLTLEKIKEQLGRGEDVIINGVKGLRVNSVNDPVSGSSESKIYLINNDRLYSLSYMTDSNSDDCKYQEDVFKRFYSSFKINKEIDLPKESSVLIDVNKRVAIADDKEIMLTSDTDYYYWGDDKDGIRASLGQICTITDENKGIHDFTNVIGGPSPISVYYVKDSDKYYAKTVVLFAGQ